MMEYILKYKFRNEKLKNLSFGDVYLTAMNEIYNNMAEGIENSNRVLNITGKVLPVTSD